MVEVRGKRLKAASLKPYRVIVDLINDVIGRLGKRSLGIVGYDQEPKATCETKVIRRSVHLLQLGDIAVVHISSRPWHGEAVAEADRAVMCMTVRSFTSVGVEMSRLVRRLSALD